MRLLPTKLIFILLLFPALSLAQTDSVTTRNFRSHGVANVGTVFMQNEARPIPVPGDVTYAITITVTNIQNNTGVLRFKFYDETTPFPDDLGFLRIVVPKSEIKGDSLTVTYYGFPAQTMGIALLDDENDNWKLDMGWFLPKEGHAFSDYYHKALRRPVYDDFKFQLTGDRHVMMKMKYY